MTSTQIIIHISGESGTGKTTLGKELQTLFGNKIFVFDCDNLYEYEDSQEDSQELIDKYKNSSQNEYLIFYKEKFQKLIKKINQENSDKIIIYVGLLDHMSMYGIYNEIDTKYKFYYSVHISTFLQRYYLRLSLYINNFIIDFVDYAHYSIQDVIDDTHPIPSSSDIIKRFYETEKIHLKMGYEPLTREEIIKRIETFI